MHGSGTIQRAAYLASTALADEKAPFRCSIATNTWPARRSPGSIRKIRAAIAEHGIRNALLTSVAPTGTISLFADNVSSGLSGVSASATRATS